MARLASHHQLDGADLMPSLRAALRLAREFDGFAAILQGIAEGNTIVLSRVIGECGLRSPALATLFHVPGRSLASRIVELQSLAFDLANDLLGIDPDAKEEPRPAARPSKPVKLAEHFEQLFGFAVGILKWTPEAAWNATPAEIVAAMEFRAEAFMSPEDRKKKEVASLSLADRARFTFATLGTRTEHDAE